MVGTDSLNSNDLHLLSFYFFGVVIFSTSFFLQTIFNTSMFQLKEYTGHKFSFMHQQTSGLLNCLSNLSITEYFSTFDYYPSSTNEGTSFLKLLTKDDSFWKSKENYSSPFIQFEIKRGWQFKPTGYLIKTADENHPKSWWIKGFFPSPFQVLDQPSMKEKPESFQEN
jgi:hypothetical protein